ncbi:MAG: hypothetical protein CVU88_00330 [Firmicutes bacterium HGW-Firmicutes-13]|nr:MAG: hypothetical protein CVU88_00330 [Firmicutes bacterium HGW-Firmicutes-13]
MKQLKIDEYNFNWDRHRSWIEFRYKDDLYRLDHSVEKARMHGIILHYGSQTFDQMVLALEDLLKIVGRGIYDLQTWISGMKYLPHLEETPAFFKYLGFVEPPSSIEEVKTRYKTRLKELSDDNDGNNPQLIKLKEAAEKAIQYMRNFDKRSN